MARLQVYKKVVYSSPFLQVREDRIQNGGNENVYNVVERSNSVVIIPLTPTKKTVLLKQYRYPTQAISLELPMGGIDKGEKSENAARRELKEETNITSKKLTYIGKFHPVPGLTPQEVDVYLAEVTNSDLESSHTKSSEQDIESLSVVDLDKVYEMISEGIITEGFTLSSLLLLQLYLKKI